MRARDRELPEGAGARHAVERGLVGIGGALPRAPGTLEEAVERVAEAYGDRAGRGLRRFGEAADGAFVWTRLGEAHLRLGRIAGPWRYDGSAAAAEVGIHHVRAATWLARRFSEEEVPAAVERTFARGGRNFQRTHDAEAERRTAALWSESRSVT